MDGKKALIGMSGGVDSSVAALLMLRAGYECIGATMRLYDNDMIGLEKGHTCCSLDDVEDARSVARRLGIPHYVFNFKDDFERQVIRKFVSCYECGGTPNPCIKDNRFPLGVSNEFDAPEAEISVEQGILLVMQTKK